MPTVHPDSLDSTQVAELIVSLNSADWSIGNVRVIGPTDRYHLVTGRNGENLIRAEGATELDAWQAAIAQARALGMLRG